MVWQIYLRNGTVYVPTVAQTEAGFYLGIEPVHVVPVGDTEAVQRAIYQAISKGNPLVATPTRANFPKPVILRYANVKSWSTFEKNALFWSVVEKDGAYKICRGRRRPDRGWEDDPTRIDEVPPGAGLDEVAQRVAVTVQSALNGG
jgi:hypothetical protein